MGCPSFRFLMRGVFSPLACLPPFPIASGSGGYPRVSNPLRQPAGLRLEPGLGALGEEPSPGSCMCTFVYWKRREGHSSQCLSTHPAPSHQVCPPRPAGLCRLMPSLLCTHCFAVGRSQWQSEQQCLAPEPPPTVSLKPHSWGSYASLPLPPSPVQEQECLQVSNPDSLPSSLENNRLLQQQEGCWTSAKSPASRN